MIVASNRVPGQLLPTGAPYHYNAGRSLSETLKRVAAVSGIADDLKATAVRGLGATDVPSLTTLGVFARGAIAYVAGRAMAHDKQHANMYGWAGVVMGGLFGVTGLAIQGAVSLYGGPTKTRSAIHGAVSSLRRK